MANYTRPGGQRFFVRGVSLLPQDAMPEGYLPFLQNIRSYQEGTVTPRFGWTRISNSPVADPVHSIFRLNDWSSLGNGTVGRYLGAGGVLYYGPATTPATFNSVDTNYSGDPLSGVIATPVASPKPWLYIGDRSKNSKVDPEGNVADQGVHQPISPLDEPTAILQPLQILPLDADTDLDLWAQVGEPAGPPMAVTRVNTVAANIVYDVGDTGACCIVPSDFTNIIIGARLSMPGDVIVVASVAPAVGSTTIAAVIFDNGTTGLCTIQPETSLATGQLEAPSFEEQQERFNPGTNIDPIADATLIRSVDFAVNSMVALNGGTPVRVISVAQGIDGVLSFRCNSPASVSAGQTIVGVPSFRTTTASTQVNGNQLLELVNQQVLTAMDTTNPYVGGMQCIALNGGVIDASQITFGDLPRATQPDDDIVLAFKADLLTFITEVRFYLNVDATDQTFLTNYYFHAWRANDLVAAIQSSNAGLTETVQQAKLNVALQQNITGGGTGSYYIAPTYNPDGSVATPGYWTGPNGTMTAVSPAQGSNAIGLSADSDQLAFGNNEWILLRCKVSDLIRVGMDTTRTLANINGVQMLVQFQGTTDPITVQYADFYLSGGFGPDVEQTLPPYIVCYRHRSSQTGAIGNPSPPLRGGVFPRRQRLTLQGTMSHEATVDLDDWFARGASLAEWSYIGSGPTGQPFNYDAEDQAIDGGATVAYDHHQPWPVSDLPRQGTCNLSGTAVQWVSGDTFNTSWEPGSAVLVNGLAGTIYAVQSETLLHLNENCGSGSGLAFTVPEPVILAQPLPVNWGGEVNGVIIRFACGDPTDPTALHWTNGNDPDTTTDGNWLFVANEQLQNGGIYNTTPFVFSSENLYRITPTFGLTIAESFQGTPNAFRADVTPCGRGLWSRWAFAIAPEGVYFLSKDGIYLTQLGVSIKVSDPDLRPIFPNDGAVGETTRGIVAPDMTATDNLRLSYIDAKLYFDYQGIDGNFYTLIYDTTQTQKGWWFDVSANTGVQSRVAEPGAGVEDQIIGGRNGNLYQYDAEALTDDGVGVVFVAYTPWINGTDARGVKQWGDAMLDCHPASSVSGLTVTPVVDNGNLAMVTVGIGGLVRDTFVIDFNSGNGVLSRTFGLIIAGNTVFCDGQRPLLYQWEPSFVPKEIVIAQRATDWEDLGLLGSKFVQGVVIRANTYGNVKSLAVQYDGGQLGATLSLLHNGEQAIAYPLAGAGWTPFTAELVRLASNDDVDWTLLDRKWVFEPAPEFATQWETQPTTFDQGGFLSARDGVVAYVSSAVITLRVFHDANFVDYSLPSTSGLYSRIYVPFQAAKGKSVKFRWTASQPFQVFKRDCSVRVQAWGSQGGYLQTMPFGGASRADGAAI